MPLLKKSVVGKKIIPEFLRDNDEVFFCELTKEIFRNYDDYFEKIMLVSSIVWTCKYTGRPNLTYAEALESENRVKDIMKNFPKVLKIALILIVKQTKRGSILELCDDVFNYMKDRYFKNEEVEVPFGKRAEARKAHSVKIIDIINTKSSNNEGEVTNLHDLKYKVKLKDSNVEPWLVHIDNIRRIKNSFTKEKIKIVLKQFIEQSKGMLVIKDAIYKKYITDGIDFSKIFIGKLPNFELSKRLQQKPTAIVNTSGTGKKLVKQSTISQYMSPDVKKKPSDEEILKRKENNALKKAERQKKLIELRELQKAELLLKVKTALKNFNQVTEDLELSDQKPMPIPKPIHSLIAPKYFGDFLYILEFMYSFSDLLSIHDKYPDGIKIEILERAFLLREAYGPLNDIIQVLLSTIFSLQLEEASEVDIRYASAYVDEKKINPYEIAISNASRVAKYALKYYSVTLEELPMDATTISELLRLHLLSSGAKINEKGARWRFQQRGGYQSADDPGLYLRIKQPHILKQLSYCTVFELPLGDIFKVIICLVDQILTYSSVRDVVEERIDKSGKAKQSIRMLISSEKRREQKIIENKNEINEDVKNKLALFVGEENDKVKYNEKLEKDAAIKIATIEATASRHKKKYLNELEVKRQEYFAHQINLGSDRAHRNYWLFESLPGLFVEHNEDHAGQCLNGITKYIPGLAQCDESQRKNFIKQMIINNNQCNNGLNNNIKEVDKENKINNIIDDKSSISNNFLLKKDSNLLQKELFMCTSNHSSCPVHSNNNAERVKWSYFHTEEDITNLINSLNSRGFREKQLKETLLNEKDLIIEHIKNCPVEKFTKDNHEEKLNDLIKVTKKYDKTNITISSFSKPDDIMKIQVRDALLDLEERIKSGYLGNINVTDRDKWRQNLSNNFYKMDCNALKWGPNKEFSKFNSHENGLNDNFPDIELGNTTTLESDSSDDEIIVLPSQTHADLIYSYACALLQIEQGIESKYYKKPFGVTKLTKDPVLNEKMLEKAKKCLENWEISLMMSTNYSQIFLHLNTLSDAIQWSQSATFAKCQICYRKNNPELMLLCDGCNRGHHMYCLKPKLNKVPTGDWFCQKCKPIEKKEKPKLTRKIFKDESDEEEDDANSVEEEQEEEVEEEEEVDEVEENDQENMDQEEMETEEVEDEEIDFDDDSNICGVCNFEGQLASCSDCSFLCHIECADPPLKRLPRANHWQCMKCRKKTSKKRNRDSIKEYGSEEEEENEDDIDDGDEEDDEPKRKSRRIKFPVKTIPIKIPSSRRSRRFDDLSFNNVALSKLLEEIIKNSNAWPFNRPVHRHEVPDYYEIIKCPMDFAKIKSKLNLGHYKSNEEMIDDIQLIFRNCDLYNNNNSDVYQAGIKLEKFVETKCKELNLPFKKSDANSTNKKPRRTN